VLLARAATPAAVGVFRVGMLPVIVSQQLSSPIRLAIFPEQARLVATGRVGELRRAARGYTLIAVGLGVAGSVVAWFALPWFIPLVYGDDFAGAVTPARILLIAAVVQIALGWRKSMLAAVGRPEINTRLAVLNLAVTVPLLLVLGDMGADGAAIAVTAGVVAGGIAWLLIAPRILSEESLRVARQGRKSVERKERSLLRLPAEQDPSVAGR
jgi:O-antigen/teichoic acid export membrane protein